MKKNYNKPLAIIICVLFLLTIAQAGMSESLNSEKKEETKNEIITQKIILYRYGINGEITPVEVEIDLTEEDLGKAMQDKCQELFEEDQELQDYFSNLEIKTKKSGLNFGWGSYRISSHGKGYHFKTKWILRLIIKIIIIKLGLPRINLPGRRRVIICNYNKDPNANTTIEPILGIIGTRSLTYIEGNHSIFVNNFAGFTTWIGRFSRSFLLPRAFYGVGTFFIAK